MYYLMIKTHDITGLKYLCKSERIDHIKYSGSGRYWKRHLKQHGYKFSTDVIFMSENIKEFSDKCIQYSTEYDIINSKEWANLIIETGLDGILGYKHNEESKKKISEAGKRKKGIPLSEEVKQKISKTLKGKPMDCSPKGGIKSEQHKENLSKAKKGKPVNFSESGLESMKKSVSDRQKIIYQCSICGKTANTGGMGRFHKQCMENENWKKIIMNDLQSKS